MPEFGPVDPLPLPQTGKFIMKLKWSTARGGTKNYIKNKSYNNVRTYSAPFRRHRWAMCLIIVQKIAKLFSDILIMSVDSILADIRTYIGIEGISANML